MKKPFYKKNWFINLTLIISLLIMCLIIFIPKIIDNKNNDDIKIKVTDSHNYDDHLEFDSNSKGIVKITGKTMKNSKVTLYPDEDTKYRKVSTRADNRGKFSFKLKLGHSQDVLNFNLVSKNGKYSDEKDTSLYNFDETLQKKNKEKEQKNKTKKEQERKNKVKSSISSKDAYLASLQKYVENGSTNDILPAISVKLDGKAGVNYIYDADKFNDLSYEEKVSVFKELENHTYDIAKLNDKPIPGIEIILNDSFGTIAVQNNLHGGIKVN